MQLSQAFFDLNLKFAQKVSAVTRQSFEQSLLQYTHLYLAFGLGRDFDPENRLWQAFVSGIRNKADPAGFTHQFYLQQRARQAPHEPENAFGCFSYALWKENRVRLHFNNSTGTPGVLSRSKIGERIAELKAMLEHLKTIVPPTARMVGGSWLYNIEAYRRLFPSGFLESARAGENEYQFIALWGQFLFSDGNVRPRMAQLFLEGMKAQTRLEGLQGCFPYSVLRLESPIEEFYAHYGVRGYDSQS